MIEKEKVESVDWIDFEDVELNNATKEHFDQIDTLITDESNRDDIGFRVRYILK